MNREQKNLLLAFLAKWSHRLTPEMQFRYAVLFMYHCARKQWSV